MHGEYNAMRLSCNGQDVIHTHAHTHQHKATRHANWGKAFLVQLCCPPYCRVYVVELSELSITNREPTKIPKSSKMALPVT